MRCSVLCSPLLLVKILAADPSSGSPPGCHRTGSGHGDPGDLEALEALTLRRFVEEVEEIWKRREGRKPDRHLTRKLM